MSNISKFIDILIETDIPFKTSNYNNIVRNNSDGYDKLELFFCWKHGEKRYNVDNLFKQIDFNKIGDSIIQVNTNSFIYDGNGYKYGLYDYNQSIIFLIPEGKKDEYRDELVSLIRSINNLKQIKNFQIENHLLIHRHTNDIKNRIFNSTIKDTQREVDRVINESNEKLKKLSRLETNKMKFDIINSLSEHWKIDIK